MAVLLVRMRVSVSVKVNIREYSSGNPRLFDVEENNLGSERTNMNQLYFGRFNVHLSICQNQKYMMLNLEVTDREVSFCLSMLQLASVKRT